MSTLGHLEQKNLSVKQIESLLQLGEMLKLPTTRFQSQGGGAELCTDESLTEKINQLLLDLDIENLV